MDMWFIEFWLLMGILAYLGTLTDDWYMGDELFPAPLLEELYQMAVIICLGLLSLGGLLYYIYQSYFKGVEDE